MAEGRRHLAHTIVASGGVIGAPGHDVLSEAGVSEGDLVLLAALPPETLLTMAITCWSLGAAVWVSPRGFDRPPEPASVLVTADSEVRRGPAVPGQAPECLAVVHETSGSTGTPKLVQRSVASLLAEQIGYRQGLGLTPGDTVRVPLPVTHSLGWGVALSALLSGCRADVRACTTPASLAADLDTGQASHVALTPPLARLLVRTRPRGGERPRGILVGAGPASAELEAACQERFGVALTRGYGSTETGGIFIGPRGIGRPIPSVEIVAPGAGERGELVVTTSAPVLGYLGDGRPPATLWHTRDIVERDASGQVWFAERAEGSVRANGAFVDVGPVRQALAEIAGVRDVAFVVLPRAGQPDGDDVYAVVAGPRVDRATAEQAIRTTAHRGLVPRLRFYERLPRTVLGKLDRTALTEWIRRDG
ncbi:class I adenylate-forming enzyme family protein [Nonomuraea sp. NPDC050540]|uniref:class I adenylate-forming enzyme family protein n=1 Tax=Nonomuraea sp. NPDC050540 TaxID=3364367 RepID=UPI003788E138